MSSLAPWQDCLKHDPQWTYLNSVVPGEEPIPIDDVFVELFATFDVPTLAATDGATRISAVAGGSMPCRFGFNNGGAYPAAMRRPWRAWQRQVDDDALAGAVGRNGKVP